MRLQCTHMARHTQLFCTCLPPEYRVLYTTLTWHYTTHRLREAGQPKQIPSVGSFERGLRRKRAPTKQEARVVGPAKLDTMLRGALAAP